MKKVFLLLAGLIFLASCNTPSGGNKGTIKQEHEEVDLSTIHKD